jgi:DNA-binding NtrC family response regulator
LGGVTAHESAVSRDYVKLFAATNGALDVLASEGDPSEALSTSFTAAADGFGARKALLLVVEKAEPLRLKCAISVGDLRPEQVAACEKGESAQGVSSSVVRSVIESRRAELIEDPRTHAVARATTALRGQNFSVLCAPVCDLEERVLAVLYFQHSRLTDPYDEADLAWLQGYATTLGRVFGLHFVRQRRQQELEQLLDEVVRPKDAPELIGRSGHIQALRRQLHEAYIPSLDARHPDPILLLGEKGTGKDLVARYLHAYSARRNRPLVVVNCAEVSEELAASRFFGHKKGAFTGAVTDELGLFRAAQHGVLFIDEITELSPRTQAALLRALENHAIVPVGEAIEVPVDVAVILATNADLDQAVERGTLRPDFYDRFRTQSIRLAPLRERAVDIVPLLEHFRSFHEARSQKRTLGFSQDALRTLVAHPWPGNVRELSRVSSLLVTHARPGAVIDRALLSDTYPEIGSRTPNPRGAPLLEDDLSMRQLLKSFKRDVILSRIERHQGSLAAARQSLSLNKTTLHRYMKELGITLADVARRRPRNRSAV